MKQPPLVSIVIITAPSPVVMVEKECDTSHYQEDDEVLGDVVGLVTEEDTEDEHRNGLRRLTQDLGQRKNTYTYMYVQMGNGAGGNRPQMAL